MSQPETSRSRSFRIRTTPEDVVDEPYELHAMNSMVDGRSSARGESAARAAPAMVAPTPFEYHGKKYASLEGFWQAMKYPEDADDPRAKFPGLEWKLTREQVTQLSNDRFVVQMQARW